MMDILDTVGDGLITLIAIVVIILGALYIGFNPAKVLEWITGIAVMIAVVAVGVGVLYVIGLGGRELVNEIHLLTGW